MQRRFKARSDTHECMWRKLPNLGQKQLKVWTNEGKLAVATFQCANVTRPLCSVSKICDHGSRVVFEGQGGFIKSPNGARTSSKRENNVCAFWMRAKEPGDQGSGVCLTEQLREGHPDAPSVSRVVP